MSPSCLSSSKRQVRLSNPRTKRTDTHTVFHAHMLLTVWEALPQFTRPQANKIAFLSSNLIA